MDRREEGGREEKEGKSREEGEKEGRKKRGKEGGRQKRRKNQSLCKNLTSWRSQIRGREIVFVGMVLTHERRESSLASINGSKKVSLGGMV